jgi:hypothetical protein
MTGETSEKGRVGIGDAHEVVPAKALLELPVFAETVARTQQARDRTIVAVRI